MAVLPKLQGREIPGAGRPVVQISPGAMAAPGEALAGVGRTMQEAGFRIQDIDDTAAAKERDRYVSDQIREMLYNPETGFTNLYGKDAVAARQQAFDHLKRIRDSAYGGLNKNSQRKLQSSLEARIDRAMQTVDTHTSGERRSWLQDTRSASIEGAYMDASTGSLSLTQAFAKIDSELSSQADAEGWDTERLDVERRKARMKLATDQIMQIANHDPERAYEMLQKNRESVGPNYTQLEARLKPVAEEAIGRKLGAAAWMRTQIDGGQVISSTTGEENPANFLAMDMDVQQKVLQLSAVFGQPIKITPHGGRQDDARKPTSQHRHGRAIDIFVGDMGANEKTQLIAQAIALGATGIGGYAVGDGAGTIHIDFRPGGGAGPGGVATWWRNTPGVDDAYTTGEQWFVDGINSGVNLRDSGAELPVVDGQPTINPIGEIMKMAPGRQRDAALDEFELRKALADSEKKMALSAATNAAFAHIEAGGNPNDLDLATRQALGMDAMRSLRTAYRQKATGVPIETDPEAYMELRLLEPEAFSATNLIEYVDRLSPTDFKKMVDEQAAGRSRESGIAASTLMTTAARQMQAAGIDTTPKPGSDDAQRVARMQSRLLEWQGNYIAREGVEPTYQQVNEQIAREMVNVVIDQGKMGAMFGRGVKELRAFEVADYMAGKDPDDTADDLTLADVDELTIGDEVFSNEDLRSLVRAMTESTGEMPTLQELIDAIIARQ